MHDPRRYRLDNSFAEKIQRERSSDKINPLEAKMMSSLNRSQSGASEEDINK